MLGNLSFLTRAVSELYEDVDRFLISGYFYLIRPPMDVIKPLTIISALLIMPWLRETVERNGVVVW